MLRLTHAQKRCCISQYFLQPVLATRRILLCLRKPPICQHCVSQNLLTGSVQNTSLCATPCKPHLPNTAFCDVSSMQAASACRRALHTNSICKTSHLAQFAAVSGRALGVLGGLRRLARALRRLARALLLQCPGIRVKKLLTPPACQNVSKNKNSALAP